MSDFPPPPDHSFPPPPPVDSPTGVDSGGSMVMGVALGFVGAMLASFSPLLFNFVAGNSLLGLLALPLLLVVSIVLAFRRSTRRTGLGMLMGFPVGFIVAAGTCFYGV